MGALRQMRKRVSSPITKSRMGRSYTNPKRQRWLQHAGRGRVGGFADALTGRRVDDDPVGRASGERSRRMSVNTSSAGCARPACISFRPFWRPVPFLWPWRYRPTRRQNPARPGMPRTDVTARQPSTRFLRFGLTETKPLCKWPYLRYPYLMARQKTACHMEKRNLTGESSWPDPGNHGPPPHRPPPTIPCPRRPRP